jgi:hypothetical protein
MKKFAPGNPELRQALPQQSRSHLRDPNKTNPKLKQARLGFLVRFARNSRFSQAFYSGPLGNYSGPLGNSNHAGGYPLLEYQTTTAFQERIRIFMWRNDRPPLRQSIVITVCLSRMCHTYSDDSIEQRIEGCLICAVHYVKISVQSLRHGQSRFSR